MHQECMKDVCVIYPPHDHVEIALRRGRLPRGRIRGGGAVSHGAGGVWPTIGDICGAKHREGCCGSRVGCVHL